MMHDSKQASSRDRELLKKISAILREESKVKKREPNSRETVHALIRKYYAQIIKDLEQEKIRKTFLQIGFSPSQFRKAALYGMLRGARKYTPAAEKDAGKYLNFYARQEVLRQIVYYSHCFFINFKTGKSFCSVPALEKDACRSGRVIFRRRTAQ